MPLYISAALIIGFDHNEYNVKEGDGNVTLTVSTSGRTTQCSETEWMILLNTTDASVQCMTDIVSFGLATSYHKLSLLPLSLPLLCLSPWVPYNIIVQTLATF